MAGARVGFSWRSPLLGWIAAGLFLAASAAGAAELRGSRASMLRQRATADRNNFTTLRRAADVRAFVRRGHLVPVGRSADLELAGVRHPYARPAVRTFVRRLARQHRRACGRKLIVTSLTRPLSEQPANASNLSVHTTGMAVDLRRSPSGACRSWLERTLLSLERAGVLDVTRERRPPHYHVAVFPARYRSYVTRLEETDDVVVPAPPRTEPAIVPVGTRE